MRKKLLHFIIVLKCIPINVHDYINFKSFQIILKILLDNLYSFESFQNIPNVC